MVTSSTDTRRDAGPGPPTPGEAAGRLTVAGRAPVHLEVVIPAYNEERRIGPALRAVDEYLERQPYSSAVVLVDNGCIDRTVETALHVARSSSVPLHVIGCATRGKGAAVRRGILTSRARFVGFMDADLATPIETLDAMMPLLESGHQVVIGSRRARGARQSSRSPARRLGSGLFRVLAGPLVPGVADSQCGFKFFETAAVQRLAVRSRVDGFSFDVEVLAAAIEAGYRIAEVPVTWSDREGSTFHSLRDGLRSMRELVSIAHSRAGGRN